jgi:protein-disulfide isomerase
MQLSHPISAADHSTGNPSAATKLLMYGDFECPDCAAAFPHVSRWIEQYGKQVHFLFRHMPLDKMYPIHPHATQASLATEAAGRQGMFWQMHDLLFQNQDALEDDDLFGYAELLGLQEDQFAADMEDQAVIAKVEADFESGKESGVTSTPGFFLNGEKIENSRDYPAIEELLKAALAK